MLKFGQRDKKLQHDSSNSGGSTQVGIFQTFADFGTAIRLYNTILPMSLTSTYRLYIVAINTHPIYSCLNRNLFPPQNIILAVKVAGQNMGENVAQHHIRSERYVIDIYTITICFLYATYMQ